MLPSNFCRTPWDDVLTSSECFSPGACKRTRCQETCTYWSLGTLTCIFINKYKKVKTASVLKRRGAPRSHVSTPVPAPVPVASSPHSSQKGKTQGTALSSPEPPWMPKPSVALAPYTELSELPPGSRPVNSYTSSHMHTVKHICFYFFRFKASECKLLRVGRLCCSDI